MHAEVYAHKVMYNYVYVAAALFMHCRSTQCNIRQYLNLASQACNTVGT